MSNQNELPRLTNYLRAFGDVAAPWSGDTYYDPNALSKKRKERTEKHARSCNLNTVKEYFVENSSLSKSDVNEMITELMCLAKEIAGTDASLLVIEGSIVYLIELFRDCKIIGNKHTTQLRQMFGTYPPKAISKAFAITRKLCDSLNYEVQEDFLEKGFPRPSDGLLTEEFGAKIKFVHQVPLDESFYLVPLRDSARKKKGDAFESLSFKFEEHKEEMKQEPVPTTSKSIPNRKRFDQQWLEQCLRKSLNSNEDISATEMAMTVMQLLKARSSEELQTELFDLLGYERMQLIEDILAHKDDIVYQKVIDVNSKETTERRPVCMSQVVIQSETEKKLLKQIHKDERRIQRDQNRIVEENNPSVLDPQRLKQFREEALAAAQNTPIFHHPAPEPVIQASRIYPNVYDIYTETKMSASFISGKQLRLPADHERINNSVFEEIRIPATKSVAKKMGVKPVLIEELDDIGKIAFGNTKQLNCIQSMVFETAYKSNHNMLVCAPTGAGKTNVAMLTIVHEIKNNVQDGKIQLNNFKIVYVAPMKALAAEMVQNFGSRLKGLGIKVKELTGDMQLTKTEIMQTQMLVTTPEKWDVVTRKSTGDVALSKLVKLLILDEVHLLDSDRGPVLETLVARTQRQVETSQSMIRIIGLSATLPNYLDVASFLGVNPMEGLYFFDDRFRPVPLAPTFIGVKSNNPLQQSKDMDEICYQKVCKLVKEQHQVMVFVHARNATVRTAMILKETALSKNELGFFTDSENSKSFGSAKNDVSRSRNKQLRELFDNGFAIHHAGMLRSDRNLVERYFKEGHIKVLVCTSTLAWGVNLPARAVIIKGTEVYNANAGSFVDLNVLDVMQIFGRAGRPQYDNKGEGTIITTHDRLSHYLSLLTRQHQIESKFEEKICDNLNAEVALGTVTNIEEGVEWLSYTYLHVRMLRNPHAYGIKPAMLRDDYLLAEYRKKMLQKAAMKLDRAHMIRYDKNNEFLFITDMGRTASHYYISTETISRFNEKLVATNITDGEIFKIICQAQEFDQLKVRDDELPELDHLLHECHLTVPQGCENTEGKVNILLQSYLSKISLESFSLISDQAYVAQNATRIARALFEMCLRKNWALRTASFLRVSKMIEKRLWSNEHPTYYNPLHQFPDISSETLAKIDKAGWNMDSLLDTDPGEIGSRLRCGIRTGYKIQECLERIPNLGIEPQVQPITDSILKITLNIQPDFKWSDKHHGAGPESFWIWICDPETDHIHHSEYFILPKKQVIHKEVQSLVCTIPLSRSEKPSRYLIQAVSDRWLGSDRQFDISFKDLKLPEHRQPHTDLLNLVPLPKKALKNPLYESLFKFDYFNPIQTQIFHTLYHTDHNVLLGAPTGSGKTIAAEIAMFRVFNKHPGTKVVYIAPLKALVRERIEDWKVRFEKKLGKNVVELTGDVTPDAAAIARADIIVTTPEKWDGVSRSWQTRNYVKAVSLIAIDEIHLLGEDRGPVLEVIVSRTNFISGHTERKLRIVGLSTALANACDIGSWLGIKEIGLYNFRSSVRPVQLEIHVSGYHGKHYCPRMALMNKPTYQAIRTHSPEKPALVFVSSRRQTRLTAQDLIAYLVTEVNPRQWMHMSEYELNSVIALIRDQNLKLYVAFGIGLHHAGLHEGDRKIAEELFLNQKIQVLIATATLAWGINLPAHLVVIKGTEYYDGKVQRYVDFPITDVMQMAGRAGRPQFDTSGVAVVLVHDIKKNFYKKFLHEPFPVESSLIRVLPEHLNAEVVAGTVSTKQQCLDYLTWTYFFRRLIQNPVYYGLNNTETTINSFLSGLTDSCLNVLSEACCLTVDEDERTVLPTVLGKIASYYYLNHKTMLTFSKKFHKEADMETVIQTLCDTHEYEELPVRHNEDSLNKELAMKCPLKVDPFTYDSPHTKANLLFQAHFSRLQLPCTDYSTDLKSVLDQAIRILQAMIDVCADRGWLGPTLLSMTLMQMVLQGRWHDQNALLTLPHIEERHLPLIRLSGDFEKENNQGTIDCLPLLIAMVTNRSELLHSILCEELDGNKINKIYETLISLPVINLNASVKGWWDESNSEELRSLKFAQQRGPRPDAQWLKVHSDQEYVLTINLRRMSRYRHETKAIAPKFPKQKEEGWFLVLGNLETKELIAMKRVPHISKRLTQQIMFYTPETLGYIAYKLYLISDCYLGLDQEYDVCLNVIEPSLRAQINSEVISDSEESSSEEET